MNAPSRWLRPLQILATVQAVAIAVLFVAWLRIEPPLPPSVAPTAATAHPTEARPEHATPRDAVASPTRTQPEAPDAPAKPTAVATAAMLFGAVRRADGTPVNDGYCWLTRDGKQAGSASLRSGTFAFAGLQPGVHRLTSRIADELALDREVTVVAPHTRLDLELAPRWLLHVDAVTADGAPLVEALTKQTSGMFFRSVRALAFPEPLAGDLPGSAGSEFEAGLGPFRANDPFFMREAKALPKQTVGVLTLPADKPAHIALLFGSTPLAQQPATPGQESVTFVLAPEAVLGKTGVVRIRCLDPQGAPVVGARVSVRSGAGSGGGPKSITDEQGRYVASNLMPGKVSFGIFHKELRMPPLQIDLVPGADIDLGDITLQKGVEVEFSFANFGGEGSVRLYWLDLPADSRWRANDNYLSPQNGLAQKTSLFPGRYGVYARGKNGTALLELDTAVLPPGPLRIDLRPGAPLRIDNRIGTGFARYEIATARGVPVYRGELGSRPGFTLELPPGEYAVTVEAIGGRSAKRSFTLPANGTTLALP